MKNVQAAVRRPSARVYAMSNYILKYSRDERVKYVSHLDFVRVFHRAVRRSGVPFVFSQGFNPHPVMTVAMPLSVGVTADGELMKVGFDGEFEPEELCERLNTALPPGFCVKKAYRLRAKEIDITKIDRAEYTLYTEYKNDKILTGADIDAFMANAELNVMKRTKSGTRETDIRPYIYKTEPLEAQGRVQRIDMCIACGNVFNLKPDTVVEAMEKYINGFAAEFSLIHRRRLLCGSKELL